MADPKCTKVWEEWYKAKGFFVLQINARTGAGVKSVTGVVNEACKEKIERDRKRGIKNRPIRAMIVGIPNVGKSTFINTFAGKACTKTGNKPGVTKGKQWIKLNKNVELLDTPGILWPKFEDQAVGKKLAISGSIKDDILNITELAAELATFIRKTYPGTLTLRYQIEEQEDAYAMLADIAVVKCCLMKGGEPNIDKAASMLIDDFRNLRLGKLTLEVPGEGGTF
jgi:ribosome biogenesis GTPase A